MLKHIALTATCLALITGCQITQTQPDGIKEEQENALIYGRVEAVYLRLEDVCPLKATDKETAMGYAEFLSSIYGKENPFHEHYTHGKKSVLSEDRKRIQRRVKMFSTQKDLLDGCDNAIQEARVFMKSVPAHIEYNTDFSDKPWIKEGLQAFQFYNDIGRVCTISAYDKTHIGGAINNITRSSYSTREDRLLFIQETDKIRNSYNRANRSKAEMAKNLMRHTRTESLDEACKASIRKAITQSISHR